MRTCISPEKCFIFGIHKPSYRVRNLRSRTRIERLGRDTKGGAVENRINYPKQTVDVPQADWIYEIANPFPFRGTTYIGKTWADRSADHLDQIRLPEQPAVSLSQTLGAEQLPAELISALPRPLLLALAATSTDGTDLTRLAEHSCSFEHDRNDEPTGLVYRIGGDHKPRPLIHDHDLFEAVANNPALPDSYKIAMVIRPGAQGDSEIVGDYHRPSEATHIYEYLRRNSYIAGGHYAANMADDAIRYCIADLSQNDLDGLRHLYYQRTYVRLAEMLGIGLADHCLSPDELETLRLSIIAHPDFVSTDLAATLWGWNFGFDFAPTGYRLHASHQQIHQQFALIPEAIQGFSGMEQQIAEPYRPFSCGDMITEAIEQYRAAFKSSLFHDYYQAIIGNQRMDGRSDLSRELIVWQDERVLLFVPKAQTSQWELQIMTKPGTDQSFVGHVIEADQALRRSLDSAILKAQQALAGRGAKLVTTIEYSKRFASKRQDQPLIYCFMPKLPQSPGAFSEIQLRFINGHYPEDFAAVCRQSLTLQASRPL
jgi:hypothetical protein